MGTMFLTNEELIKKNDDHKPTKIPVIRPRWTAATGAQRGKTLKRLAISFAVIVLVFLFITNFPTDEPIRDRLPDHDLDPAKYRAPGPMPKLSPGRKTPWQKPNRQPGPAPDHSVPSAKYNGPVKSEKLAQSLEAIHSTGGSSPLNKNVLFAAASLKSVALLLPMACQMGGQLRNYVHFVLLGGSGIDLTELRAVNGIDESCEVIFHDGRPDFATESTTGRLKASITRALYQINDFMHPQALIVDTSGAEEDYFLASIRTQASTLDIPVIELPEDARSRLGWITKLDSSSLAAWKKMSIGILVHASPATSGSLVHLLKSLSAADFSAGPVPHLTIELPHNVDRATTEYLKTLHWPPGRPRDSSYPQQLTLRRRIPRTRLTEEESSVRFLESFWPNDPKYSHVLVLSPHAQLSPQFFHYLKYSALHYLYSGAALRQEWDSRLLGISLDLPSTLLDGATRFSPPPGKKGRASTPFLWQAPDSSAVLFSGRKWAELHALVSESIEYQQRAYPVPPFFADKVVSKRHPSWLEHALRLSRARGYWTLYPSEATARSLATVHGELYRVPEEYEQEAAKSAHPSAERPVDERTLFESLPGGGGRPLPFDEMPLLLWDGAETTLAALDNAAAAYADGFRRAVGGCEALVPEDLVPRMSMRDLFCMRDG